MPRSKLKKSEVIFDVNPWQDKAPNIKQDDVQDTGQIEFFEVDESKLPVTASSSDHKRTRAQSAPPRDPSEWINKPVGQDCALEERSQSAVDGILAEAEMHGSATENVMDPTEPQVPQTSTVFCGTCFLAILPSGHMSGQVAELITSDQAKEPSGRTLGIVARCIASSSGRPGECMEDSETDFLRISIINLQTDEEAEALVSKTGGDMVRIIPAESWQISSYLPGISSPSQVEEAMQVQVNFVADQLFEGDDAEVQLRNFNQKRLLGRDAVVNIGRIEVMGLRPGFT